MRVERIGADGDGLALGPGGKPLYLANTLPGELVRPGPLAARGDGFAAEAEIMERSADRVAPPCRHFGPCGGCTLQHWRDEAYAAWKAGRIGAALRTDAPPLARTPPGARRRIDLAIRREGPAIRLGLHRRRSTDIVDMHECPVLHPALFTVVQGLRPVLLRLQGLRREGSAVLNLLDTGPDLFLQTDAALTAGDRGFLAEFARAQEIPRISSVRKGERQPESAAQLGPAITAFSGRNTDVPPGAFLQASRAGEQAITEAVLRALPAKLKGPIVELFAGCGTLTHALAGRGRVMAYEGDAALVAALRRAGNSLVTATERDLARQPLGPAELKGAAAVVLDPPFRGAAEQMPALAASGVPVVYVSCNPGALARDARNLLGAGYRLASLAGIDQFLWSAQVEAVAAFIRAP